MLATDVGRGAPDRLGPGRLRVRPPDLGAALRRRVPDRVAQRLLLRRLRRDDPDARPARGLRPGELAHRTAAARSRSSPATASAACSSSCCAGRTRSRVDAVSFLWSARLPRPHARSTSRPARRARSGGLMAGRALDPRQRDHPRRAARRRDAQLLQLHLLRAVRALRDAARSTSRRRRSGSCSASPRSARSAARSSPARIVAAHRRRAGRSRSAASSSPRR